MNTQAVQARRVRVAQLDGELEAKAAEVTTADEMVTGLERRQRENEARLSDIENKMKDRRMQIARIRNDKELGLIRREIELFKEESGTLETEVLTILEQLDGYREGLAKAQSEHEALVVDRQQEANDLDATVNEVADAMEKDQGRRHELLQDVEDGLHERYELIFERRDGLAVVGVRAGTCQGCHMNVPPQLFNQIQRNEQVLLCPSCQRILFWQPEDTAE